MPAPERAANPLGVAALVVGVAALIWKFLAIPLQLPLLQEAVDAGMLDAARFSGLGQFSSLGAFALFSLLLVGVLGLIAVVLGILALTRRGRPALSAAIGLGIGITLLVDVVAESLYVHLASGIAL